MPKIKIVHLTSVHSPFDIRIFHKQCKTLVNAGYEVVVIAPHVVNEIVDGIQIRAVAKQKRRLVRMLFTTLNVFFSALKECGQVYHIHDPELFSIAQILRLLGKQVIIDMHENTPKAIATKPWINPLFRRVISLFYRFFERILLFRIPVIFAEDSYVKDYKWIKERAVVLNMPIVDQLMDLKESKYSIPTLGYIGGVTPERGSLVVLQALQILKEKGSGPIHWVCIGPISDSHKSKLISLKTQYSLPGVEFYGYMPPTEGWRMIARCHIGLAVLKPIPNYFDSYPTKMFEYMALGLPVVVSNFPLYRTIVETAKCGICVDPLNPIEIVKAIQWLLAHPDEARRMGENGRKAVMERYNWDNESKKLLELYEQILITK